MASTDKQPYTKKNWQYSPQTGECLFGRILAQAAVSFRYKCQFGSIFTTHENMDNQKFLGICLVVAAVIISGAIYLHDSRSRYQFQPSNPPGVIFVFDTWTGEVKTR